MTDLHATAAVVLTNISRSAAPGDLAISLLTSVLDAVPEPVVTWWPGTRERCP